MTIAHLSGKLQYCVAILYQLRIPVFPVCWMFAFAFPLNPASSQVMDCIIGQVTAKNAEAMAH
jgi:hypothetical protein